MGEAISSDGLTKNWYGGRKLKPALSGLLESISGTREAVLPNLMSLSLHCDWFRCNARCSAVSRNGQCRLAAAARDYTAGNVMDCDPHAVRLRPHLCNTIEMLLCTAIYGIGSPIIHPAQRIVTRNKGNCRRRYIRRVHFRLEISSDMSIVSTLNRSRLIL